MGVKKVHLGKVVGNIMGYNIRIMLEDKTREIKTRDGKGKKDTFLGDSGKFGVYARKKLVKNDFKTKEEATQFINELIAKKK